ncbi:MAG: hypothetical protein NTV52_11000, partial [Acidobacteria bacterium]|nr:hypothetical protein [Acidobacteriota bacterium]
MRFSHMGTGPRERGALGAALALLFLVLGLALGAAEWVMGLATVVGFLVGWFGTLPLGLGLRRGVLWGFRGFVLPGESLVVVETKEGRAAEVMAVLRRTGHPSVFAMRPGLRFTTPTTGLGQRREPTNVASLGECGSELATGHEVEESTRSRSLLPLLRECEEVIEESRADLAEAARLEYGVSPAAEWLLDNAYLIRSNIADIRHGLPDNHNKILPVLKDDRCAVRLRVYHLAAELIDGTAHRLTEECIVNFLNGYQEESPLTIAELWVYPLMLRLVLAERLRRLTERASLRQHQKESADFWADRFLNAAERTVPDFDEMVAELGRRGEPITPHFMERLGEQLHQEETALVPIQNWIQEKTGHRLVDVIRLEQTDEASELLLIAGAIGSLRELSELQYPRIVESVSRMERILQEDPAGIHGRSDFATRDRCRQAVETVARHSKASELEVARAAVQLARGGEEGSSKGCVGYYLLDAGKLELEARLESQVTWREGRLRFLRRYPTCVYIGTLVGLTTGLSTAFGVVAYRAGLASEGVLLLLGILALFPASELATYLLHLVLTSMLPPRVLPKMSFEKGIPEDCRTLVVVPMMLLTPDSIQGEVDKLEVRYFSNPEENVWYSLLSDFTDATEREMLEDDGLLGLAMKLVEG